jgi:hypothetical protein
MIANADSQHQNLTTHRASDAIVFLRETHHLMLARTNLSGWRWQQAAERPN